MAKILLAQGSSVTLTLGATDAISLNSNKTGSAKIEAASGIVGSENAKILATHPGGYGEYGPWGAGAVKLGAIGGDVSYEVGDSLSLNPNQGTPISWAEDSAGNVVGLVGPDGATFPVIAPITTPSGYRGTTLATAMDMRRTLNGIVTNFDITSLIPSVTKIYYVDPINGSNANSGLTAPLAKKDLATVLAIADVDQIIITGLTADFVGLGAQSWNNTQPSRSLSVINNTGFRYISAACASLPTWAVNGTYSNVYSTVIGATSAAGVTDVSTSSTLAGVNARGAVVSLSNVPKRYRTLTKVASLAAVAATAGTFFHDGTSLHVRAHDDRDLVGDTKMLPTTTSQNGRFPASTNNITIYVQSLDFVGGNSAFYMGMASTVTGCVFAHNNCSFQGANTAHGLTVLCFGKVYGYKSGAYDNFLDGYNYHSFESDGTTQSTSPDCAEIECAAIGNGSTGSSGTSDNASTSHDFCNVIRLNCNYIDSADRVMVESNSAHSWNIGCVVGASTAVTAGKQNIAALSTSRVWLDSCYAVQGSNPAWIAAQTAVLKHFTSGEVIQDSGVGEATGTVSAYYG